MSDLPLKKPNPQSLRNTLNSIEIALQRAGHKNCGLATRSQHELLLATLNGQLRDAVSWIEAQK